MNFEVIKAQASTLFANASFIARINNQADYDAALALMDELIEDYDQHKSLIEVLSVSIERWEDSAEEFAVFNQTITSLDSGVAMLTVLMDQHGLNTTDFKDEIGGKSMVSMILNGSRQLNLGHIRKLSARFGVPGQLFI
ncbi:MAG: HTH-type transcriptional regulator/antitoxin HigA [Phenylobacterium sp.]|jgi:HTH-type transcriptional regulator/antitoxin HigA